MISEPIHDELMKPEVLNDLRAMAIQKTKWFVHTTPVSAIASIKTGGLQPRATGTVSIPKHIKDQYGWDAPVLCLSPLCLSSNWHNSVSHSGQRTQIAIQADNIPRVIGLDWTFPPSWELAALIKQDDPNKLAVDVFEETVRRTYSFVVYETIPPQNLRVFTEDRERLDPSTWQPLLPELD